MKLTITDIKNFCEKYDLNKDATLLSTEYINNRTPLLFKCNRCGIVFKRTFSNLQTRKIFYCSNCSKKIVSNNRKKYTINDVRQYLIENKINPNLLLSTEMDKKKDLLTFKCEICGNIYQRSFDNLCTEVKYKNMCSDCGKRTFYSLLYTEDDVKKNIEKDGYILLETYKNAHTRVSCQCKRGHIFGLKYSDYLYSHVGCPFCAIINQSGENASNWKDGRSITNQYLRDGLKNWKQKILKQYNYQCDITGNSNNLEIHHLNQSYATILDQAIKELNINKNNLTEYTPEELFLLKEKIKNLHINVTGVPVTKELHSLFHKQYGYYNTTEDQYYQFKNQILNNMK